MKNISKVENQIKSEKKILVTSAGRSDYNNIFGNTAKFIGKKFVNKIRKS